MKELDLLKKDWNKEKHPKVSTESIYKMILKKSSSVVKWIFIISVIELAIGLIASAFIAPNFEAGITLPKWIELPTLIISFIIPLFFSYKFYINYKTINITNSIKELLNNIIKTRKSVKQYVIVNITYAGILIAVMFGYITNNGVNENGEALIELNSTSQYIAFGFVIVLTIIVFIAVVLFIYFLLYGILMRKLNRNYKELKKLDL